MDSFHPDVKQFEQQLRIVATTPRASRPDGAKDLLAIAMQPIDDQLRKAVVRIELVIAESDGRLQAVGYDDPQGDHVRIAIDAVEVNVALDAALFAIEPPKGTTILEHDVGQKRPPAKAEPRRG
jgi:outer membrane lipoprotein-sorting protein